MSDGTHTIPADFTLPTTKDGADEALLQLADIFGDLETYRFLGLVVGNGTGSVIGHVRAALAYRRIAEEMHRKPVLSYEDARVAVGKEFGFSGTGLSNWQKVADRGRAEAADSAPCRHSRAEAKDFHLPIGLAGADKAMLQLADIFGDVQTFQFLGLLHGNNTPGRSVRAALAARAVAEEMRRDPELTYKQARLAVGKKFGYSSTKLTNWNKIANLGRDNMIARGDWPFPTDQQ